MTGETGAATLRNPVVPEGCEPQLHSGFILSALGTETALGVITAEKSPVRLYPQPRTPAGRLSSCTSERRRKHRGKPPFFVARDPSVAPGGAMNVAAGVARVAHGCTVEGFACPSRISWTNSPPSSRRHFRSSVCTSTHSPARPAGISFMPSFARRWPHGPAPSRPARRNASRSIATASGSRSSSRQRSSRPRTGSRCSPVPRQSSSRPCS